MTTTAEVSHEVVTAAELALAAGVPVEAVETLILDGDLRVHGGRFIAWNDAVGAGRRLRAALEEPIRSGPAQPTTSLPDRSPRRPERAATGAEVPTQVRPELFSAAGRTDRAAVLPVAVSSAVHGLGLLIAIVLTSTGLGTAVAARVDPADFDRLRLVFLAIPGPGGGGGGGGARQLAPPPRARRAGVSREDSPVPVVETPKPIEPAPVPEEPPEPPLEEPRIVAPVATAPADEIDRDGVLERTPSEAESRGSGTDGGVGTGGGSGIGEGSGPGIGPGSGGGTGGGPYRPGSGIEPPRLLREVRADYTEEARLRGIQGEVLLEIVVRRDGGVGDVRLLQGLGYGLDRRAIDAVRQWRFAPARRLGTPVDVLVEVAVEFRLR